MKFENKKYFVILLIVFAFTLSLPLLFDNFTEDKMIIGCSEATKIQEGFDCIDECPPNHKLINGLCIFQHEN